MTNWSISPSATMIAQARHYEAFPDAVRINGGPHDGRIVAAWGSFETHYGPGHGRSAVSDDNGATWSAARQMIPNVTHVGPVAVASLRGRVAAVHTSLDTAQRSTWIQLSDDGVSWGAARQVTGFGTTTGFVFASDLLWIDDGTADGLMLLSTYGPDGVLLVQSSNAGVTWARRAVVVKRGVWQDATETSMCLLPSGELVMLLRNDTNVTIELLRSSNMGRTWSAPRVVFSDVSGMPRMTLMPGGDILATFRDESGDHPAQGWAVGRSSDGGASWSYEHLGTFGAERMMYGRFVAVDAENAVLVGASDERVSNGRSRVWSRTARFAPKAGRFADAPARRFAVRLVAHFKDGKTEVLRTAHDIEAELPFNGTPALRFTLANEEEGGRPQYRRLLGEADVALEVRWEGMGPTDPWHEPPNARFILIEEDADGAAGRGVQYEGIGVYHDLTGILNYADDVYRNSKTDEHEYKNMTPGMVMRLFCRGARDVLNVGSKLTWGFSDTHDSNGDAWKAEDRQEFLNFAPGTSAADVLEALEAKVDWRFVGNTLQLVRKGGFGVDRSGDKGAGPVNDVALAFGREFVDLKQKRSALGAADWVYGVGESHWTVQPVPADARRAGTRGHRMASVRLSDAKTYKDVVAGAQDWAKEQTLPGEEYSRDLLLQTARYLPFLNFRVGDIVSVQNAAGAWVPQMVTGLLFRTDEQGALVVNVHLGSGVASGTVKLAKHVRKTTGGGAVAGSSGKVPQPARYAAGPPAPPTGVAGVATGDADPSGVTVCEATVSWSAPTVTANGLDLLAWEIFGYRVEGRLVRVSMESSHEWVRWGETGTLGVTQGGLLPDREYEVRVAAESKAGWGRWSDPVKFRTPKDETPPPPPSAPAGESSMGMVTWTWDGKTAGGAAQPSDFSHATLAWSGVRDGQVVSGTLRMEAGHTLVTGPFDSGTQASATLTSVDVAGNESKPGDATEVSVSSVLDDADLEGKFQQVEEELIAPLQAAAEAANTRMSDIEASAQDTHNLAVQAVDDAEAKAAAAEAAAKAYAEAQAAAAQAAAIAEAEGTAEAKAAAAEAAAIAAAALDAQAKADAAQAAAEAKAQAALDAANAAADAASDASAEAGEALTSANARNSVIRSLSSATGSTNPNTGLPNVEGDVWWRMSSLGDGGRVIGQWTWDGAAWRPSTISHETISSVDVNSLLVTGTARINTAVLDKFIADAAHVGALSANRVMVGDGTNLLPSREGVPVDWDMPSTYEMVTQLTSVGPIKTWIQAQAAGGSTTSPTFEVEPGGQYRVEMWMYSASSTGRFYQQIIDRTATSDNYGNGIASMSRRTWSTSGGTSSNWVTGSGYTISNQALPAGWRKVTTYFEVPEGVYAAAVKVWLRHPNGDDVVMRVTGVTVHRLPEVVVDGSITSRHVLTGSLRADSIEAGSFRGYEVRGATLISDLPNDPDNNVTIANQTITVNRSRGGDDPVATMTLGGKSADRIQLTNSSGASRVFIDGASGDASFHGEVSGEVLRQGGDTLDEILDAMPKGIIGHYWASGAAIPTWSNTTYGLFGATWTIIPGRRYKVTLQLHLQGTQNDSPFVAIRHTAGTTLPTINSPITAEAYGAPLGPNAPVGGSKYETQTFTFVIHQNYQQPAQYNILATIRNWNAAREMGLRSGVQSYIVVEDMGPTPTLATMSVRSGGGKPYSGSGPGDSTPAQRQTKTYNAHSVRSWRGSTQVTDTLHHGYYGGYQRYSQILFPSTVRSDLSGASIEKVEVYLKNEHTWAGSGMTARILPATNTSLASSPNTSTGQSFSWARGAGKWVTITGWTSSSQSIFLGGGAGTGTAGYGKFSRALSDCRLRVTYTK